MKSPRRAMPGVHSEAARALRIATPDAPIASVLSSRRAMPLVELLVKRLRAARGEATLQ